MTSPPVSLIRDIPFCQGLTSAEIEHIASVLHMLTLPAGTSLFAGEQPGEVAYFILKGAIKVYIEQPDGKEVILAILGPGEMVGEMSLIDHLARSATAVTIDDCDTLWMDRTEFWRCLQMIPPLNYNLARFLARRLRRSFAR
jgi:CRP/FNR family cyclic AMP-dependent transcriptional regulator